MQDKGHLSIPEVFYIKRLIDRTLGWSVQK